MLGCPSCPLPAPDGAAPARPPGGNRQRRAKVAWGLRACSRSERDFAGPVPLRFSRRRGERSPEGGHTPAVEGGGVPGREGPFATALQLRRCQDQAAP